MATAETARLIASLELKDNFSPGANKAIASLGKLESTSFRVGQQIGKGVNNAVRNIQRIAIAGGIALVGAVAFGIRSLEDLDRTVQQTNAVIASTKGKAGVSAAAVRDYAQSLENVTTVDDKVIQDGENMLLTFTGIGKDVFPRATKAALNMAVAMAGGNVEAVDLKASAIQLGKALNDPVKGITALRKVGVAFTADQIKQIKTLVAAGKLHEAQVIILKELETEFGKAGAAAGKGPGAAWRRLQDAGEDLSQSLARGLLPVLTKAATWLSTKLADPAVVRTIDALGVSLGNAADQAFAFIQTVDFKSIADALGTAAGFAGNLVNAFLGMPSWVQTAVITGWGLNKLTGGAVSGIIGELGKGLIKGVLGINAGVVNVNAAAVNGGGLPGAAGAAGGLGLVSKMFLVGEAIGLSLIVNEVRKNLGDRSTAQSVTAQGSLSAFLAQSPTRADLRSALGGVEQGIHDIESNPLNVLVQGEALDNLRKMRADLSAQLQKTNPGLFGLGAIAPALIHALAQPGISAEARSAAMRGIVTRASAAGFKPTSAAVEATFERNIARQAAAQKAAIDRVHDEAARTTAAARATAAAIKDKDAGVPIVNIKVNVTAAQVTKSIVVQRRFGPSGGSRERGPTEF